MRATARGLSVYSSTGGKHATAHGGIGNICTNVDSSTGDCQDYDYTPISSSGYDVTTGTTAPATDWSKVLSGITNSFTSIFKAIQPVPAGCSMVQTAQGSSVQCLSSIQQASGTSSFTSLLGSGSSSTILLLVAGVAAIMILKK